MGKMKELEIELLDSEGFADRGEFIEEFLMEGAVPAICKTCRSIDRLEPDQTAGYCESCKTNTMVSGLILMGVI